MAHSKNIRENADSVQDQASRLREWVRQQTGPKAGITTRRPGLVVVLGGRPGVGVTTLSANLAAALTAAGQRTVLLDMDLRSAGATQLCRVRATESLAEVVLAGRTLREVVQPGPGGIHVVPGIRPGLKLPDDCRYASQRILDGLRGLASLADVAVADVGNELSPWTWALWRAAQSVLAVTTPDPAVLMDIYSVLKALTTQAGLAPVHLVVNRAGSEAEALDVYERVARTCLRFLALPVTRAGFIPADPRVEAAGLAQGLLWTWTPAPDSASSLHQLACYVTEALGKASGPKSRSDDSPAKEDGSCLSTGSPGTLDRSSGPCWSEVSAGPPHWHVHTSDWAGKLGFPVTLSPSLDIPAEENSKKV